MPAEFECQTAKDMLASFLKAGAVHSCAFTAAFTKGCQINPLTLAELGSGGNEYLWEMNEVVHETAPGSAGASTSLSKFPNSPVLLQVLIYGTFPDKWTTYRNASKPDIADTPVTQTGFQVLTNLTASLTLLDEGFWASQHRSPHATHTSPAGIHPPLHSSPGEMTTVFVGSQTKWSHRLSLSQNPWNCACSTQLE